jgi:hypothetical protein
MQQLKFSKLSLWSQKERRALQIEFTPTQNVLVAENGFGKSAILKSLYEAFGAPPHKIDKAWNDAGVGSLVEFTLGQKKFAALKTGGSYTIYDGRRAALINTTRVTAELAPFLADLLDFRLVLADKREAIRVPPPSYAFAPFYVDQDRSWQKPWDSFKDLGMFPGAAKSLAEYHSGLRPNSYYEAKAERDRINAELSELDRERNAVHQALKRVRESMPAAPLALDLQAFASDTERLVVEGQRLHDKQARYRAELGALKEEFHVWAEQVALVEAGLKEVDEAYTGSLEVASEIECPMCGQHYHNHIADQFELVADKDELLVALHTGRSKLREAEAKIETHKQKLKDVSAAIDSVQAVMTVHKEDISLRDVVAAEGRNEAQRYLQERLAELDADYGSKQRRLEGCAERMRAVDSKQRKQDIQSGFSQLLRSYAAQLDVRVADAKQLSLQGLHIGRGSEGPRALAVYYYSFLHTAKQHGSSAFCPIVVDAPNQQGQDKGHLRKMMQFLLSEAPSGAQIIIASETSPPPSAISTVVDVSWKKDQVLREDKYTQVLDYVSPFLSERIL